MGCPSDVIIGNSLTFNITTHDRDTAVVTDTDSAPTYRVYENTTGTPILTGTMTKPDPTRVGFYVAQVDCTLENGFENGKSYSIAIEATVNGTTGALGLGFSAHTHVWAWASRTLTQSAGQIIAAVTGTSVAVIRGDYWTVSLTGAGSLVGRTKLYFTLKEHTGLADSQATVQLEESVGLLVSNGAVGVAGNGSLVVDDEVLGNFTLRIKADETTKYAGQTYLYDLQMHTADGPVTRSEGTWVIAEDVTRTIT